MKKLFILLILLNNQIHALKIANLPTQCDPNDSSSEICKNALGSAHPNTFCISNKKINDRSLNSPTGGYCGYLDKNGVIVIP